MRSFLRPYLRLTVLLLGRRPTQGSAADPFVGRKLASSLCFERWKRSFLMCFSVTYAEKGGFWHKNVLLEPFLALLPAVAKTTVFIRTILLAEMVLCYF